MKKKPPTRRRASVALTPRPSPPQTPAGFIASHPVFHVSELEAFYEQAGRPLTGIPPTLGYHVQAGRLLALRRGVYIHADFADPWLVGSRMTEDAVLAYDGALSFYRQGSWGHHMTYLTARRARTSVFADVEYYPITVPSRRGHAPELEDQVVEVPHAGLRVRVTSYERTLVDCADRLDLAGEPLDLFARFQSMERKLDFGGFTERVGTLRSRIVAARVGVFLHGRLDVPERVERRLLDLRPRTPTYLLGPSQRATGGRLFGKWNVLVPHDWWERLFPR